MKKIFMFLLVLAPLTSFAEDYCGRVKSDKIGGTLTTDHGIVFFVVPLNKSVETAVLKSAYICLEGTGYIIPSVAVKNGNLKSSNYNMLYAYGVR